MQETASTHPVEDESGLAGGARREPGLAASFLQMIDNYPAPVLSAQIAAYTLALAQTLDATVTTLIAISIALLVQVLARHLGRHLSDSPAEHAPSDAAPTAAFRKAAHDFRTRLAIIRLQMDKITHTDARDLGHQVQNLAARVDELEELAERIAQR